jgi:DNA repair exonuclease SbcCD ATPase subunit
VENQFVEEQVRYKKERQKLEDRIKEESTRLLRAKSQLERESKKFNEDQQELDEKLQMQSQQLDEAEQQLKRDQDQYNDETGRLQKLVDEEKTKLKNAEDQIAQEKRDFANAKKNYETRITNERAKVKDLSERLKVQTESHEKQRVELQNRIVEEKARLAEIKEELEAETLKFNEQKKKLQEDINYEKRAREVKSRQMADRYDSIQKEMTDLWQGAKDEARKEKLLITKKYEAKLSVVTDSIERLENKLANEEQIASDLQVLIDDVAIEKRKILDQQKTEEAGFVRQVAGKNAIITQLQGDVSTLRRELEQRDAIIEEYETSFGKILKQSVKLSGKRIRRSGARLRKLVARDKKDDDSSSFQ